MVGMFKFFLSVFAICIALFVVLSISPTAMLVIASILVGCGIVWFFSRFGSGSRNTQHITYVVQSPPQQQYSNEDALLDMHDSSMRVLLQANRDTLRMQYLASQNMNSMRTTLPDAVVEMELKALKAPRSVETSAPKQGDVFVDRIDGTTVVFIRMDLTNNFTLCSLKNFGWTEDEAIEHYNKYGPPPRNAVIYTPPKVQPVVEEYREEEGPEPIDYTKYYYKHHPNFQRPDNFTII